VDARQEESSDQSIASPLADVPAALIELGGSRLRARSLAPGVYEGMIP
jgi:hypothetical protein